ncbi:hypothetical protein B1F79_04190 [Coxiella-like endosymbiont of Rhipicephalus sanguineus]|nr:hypothetical protein [Coxiella-like endosymbiont of Rhipicephalus sanguineus]
MRFRRNIVAKAFWNYLFYKDIHGKIITFFCGENTRPYLKHKLRERGGKTFLIFCYQVEAFRIGPKIIETLTKKSIHAIVSTSVESLQKVKVLFSSH